MRWHLLAGEEGCRFARENDCLAIVVDALRASATAAYLLESGAERVLAVGDVEVARRAKDAWPDALFYGERGGVPLPGMDHGNSPQEAHHAAGRSVVFTTTTGAGRVVACKGAGAILMASTVNASAAVEYARQLGRDVVCIPAGLMDDPGFDAQEDWTAAAYVMMEADGEVCEGLDDFNHWRGRIEAEGVEALFETAPHSEKLRKVGMDSDIAFCAQCNTIRAVPAVSEWNEFGAVLTRAALNRDTHTEESHARAHS